MRLSLLELILGHNKDVARIAHGFYQHERAEVGDKLVAEPRHVLRFAVQAVDIFHRSCGVFVYDTSRKLVKILFVSQAGRLTHGAFVYVVAYSYAAVEQRERVAQRAVGYARDKQRGFVGYSRVLLTRDVLHPVGDSLRRYPVKVEPLAARKDGLRQLVHLGGRKDEDDVLGRFLQRFQQGVERLGGQHVHLVYDVNAVARLVRLVLHLVDDVADILDLAVGRRVHLDYIEDAAVLDALADLTFAARTAVFGFEAVYRLCQNLGAGGFARAARAREQIGVVEPVFDYLIFQRGRDVLLTRNVIKSLGSPFAVQHLIQGSHLRLGQIILH